MLASQALAPAPAHAAFDGGRGYLAACTAGIPPRAATEAMRADLDASASGRIDIAGYTAAVERSRTLFAAIVGVDADRIAIGSQVSVTASLIAASLPHDAEVLVPEGEFSSIVLPFVHAGRSLRMRTAALSDLAEAIGPDTALVAFSAVQSATGEVADLEAIAAAADRHGARTFCDATQAVGWLPIDASRFDALVCHAYKWLCAPRGVSFLAVSADFADALAPVHAGWYAGADPWSSCYGGDAALAAGAGRFDVSPAWQAFVGAAPALQLFARADLTRIHDHATGLAARFRRGLGLPRPARASAIVTWDDPTGRDLALLTAAGITASGRAGRARVAFHLFNDEVDLDDALRALGAR
ncbi:aminotransferase class V-fold PLP-dependent enzyme [Microbacterium hominis]|uniref:Aminotransferase class V-fold PLP-dependent enzyme n=1 Tax=Microbacterium hominis TaxID=162426 RepID=A0A7D4PM19_9MICO|nr:aminotransferase class V-fold PLP-dependent enzyme [Microbacterium hominis]QKJ19230.1 aminotransferase class V-fold PLP-dependent enzyme [Microbacterium hominis]